MKLILQYFLYKRHHEGFYAFVDTRFQKHLSVLALLLRDSVGNLDQCIDYIKSIQSKKNLNFNESHLYYDALNDMIEVDENIGYDDEESFPSFITTQDALISILQRWEEVYHEDKQFLLMTLDENNYVDFVTFDTEHEVDSFLKMNYKENGDFASA